MMAMPGGFHPGGMQQHPGVPPGHHMAAPGMAHNPSQPGAQPGMPQQMAAHMAASGPGGQVNPAAMMGGGMAPGAGPNAHAMHHLNPQMFQQQQQFACKSFFLSFPFLDHLLLFIPPGLGIYTLRAQYPVAS